jgi:hypothetical protein
MDDFEDASDINGHCQNIDHDGKRHAGRYFNQLLEWAKYRNWPNTRIDFEPSIRPARPTLWLDLCAVLPLPAGRDVPSCDCAGHWAMIATALKKGRV